MEKKRNEKEWLADASLLCANGYAALRSADELDLKVLLALLALPEDAPHTLSAVCDALDEEEDVLQASVKFWQGAGVLLPATQKKKATASAKKATTSDAHADGKLERASQMPSYSTEELTKLIESNHIMSQFIDEAQRILGRIFNTHEINILVGMVDYVGLEHEAVLLLLSHMKNKKKITLAYIEKVAFGLYDQGITTAEELENHFRRQEQWKEKENQVRALFGMGGRELTTKETKFLHAWCDEMNYDVDVIRLAYEITVDAIHEPAPAYTNSILEKWHSAGLRTAEEVQAYLSQQKKDAAPSGGSFDTDEFFDAALRRSLDEFLN